MEDPGDKEGERLPLFADEAAFEAAFRAYYAPLYRLVRPMVKSGDKAEDIIQELFIRLWNRRENLSVSGSLKSYLYRAAVNAALDFLEKHKKEVRLDDHPGWDRLDHASGTEEEIEGAEMESHITIALDKLPPACKTIFLMSREKEMSYKEIASALEISVKTVENQMGKALRILREELKPYIKNLIKLIVLFFTVS